MFCEAFGLARIRVTFGHIHRHVGDTSGHIRHTRGTHWEHIVQKRVDTQENTGHTAKNGADTPDTSRIYRGHIGFSTHAGHRRTHRGHIPTSQAHALNVLCPCLQPFCFLSQPAAFVSPQHQLALRWRCRAKRRLFLKSAQKPLLLRHGLCMMIFTTKTTFCNL